MANINKIKLSGTSYDIQDSNAARSVTLTQAQYDALQTKDPNVFYIISDSSIEYMTSADTESAITQAVSGKQDTLVSGTNIKTINNQSLLGSGNISIQAGGISSVEADYDDTVQPNGEFDILINDGSSYSQIFIVGDGLQVTEENGNTILSATGGGISSGEVQTMIDSSISGKTNQSDFSAHTANTTVHVTAQDKTNWNAKSDFSGSYNDLTDKPTIPTVPTSNTAFTNDAGYITSDAISGKADTSAVTESINAAVSGKVDTTTYTAYTAATDTVLNGKVNTSSVVSSVTSASTDSEIPTAKAVFDAIPTGGTGGGKAISAGTNISVTTGETADTINCTLNLVNGGGTDSVKMKNTHSSNGSDSFAIGSDGVKASGLGSFAGGSYSEAKGIFSMAFGRYSITNNYGEVALGFFGKSNGSSNAPSQSSGNTLFSLGNGTNAYGGQHNAFEVRQNGDIYITLNDQDVKLQDQLGGGGGVTSGEVQTMIDESISGLTVELTQAEYDALVTGGTVDPDTFYVITDAQEIDTSNYYTTAQTQSAITQAVSGKADVSAVTTVNNTLTAHTADTTIHVTTAQTAAWDAKQNALTIDSTVTSGSTNPVSGGAVYTQFGGLKLVKLTQAQYNALSTKDNNTLYVIVN